MDVYQNQSEDRWFNTQTPVVNMLNCPCARYFTPSDPILKYVRCFGKENQLSGEGMGRKKHGFSES